MLSDTERTGCLYYQVAHYSDGGPVQWKIRFKGHLLSQGLG